MTIIIAGYVKALVEGPLEIASQKASAKHSPRQWAERPVGIYVMADSAISSGNETILNEFKKIYEMDINIFEPRIAGSVRGFDVVQYSQRLVIAFAGNTLTAQHVLNQISYHVGALRVVMGRDGNNRVIKPCEPHGMDGIYFSPHDPHDFSKAHQLIDAEYIRGVVVHGFDLAVRAARRYKRDENGWKSLFTDMVVGFQCPRTASFELFKLSVEVEVIDGISYPRAECTQINPGQLCVLGADWSEEAFGIAESARSRFLAEDSELFDWMVARIDAEMKAGHNHVARPAVLKVLNSRSKLETARTAGMLEEQFDFDRERARKRFLESALEETCRERGDNEII